LRLVLLSLLRRSRVWVFFPDWSIPSREMKRARKTWRDEDLHHITIRPSVAQWRLHKLSHPALNFWKLVDGFSSTTFAFVAESGGQIRD